MSKSKDKKKSKPKPVREQARIQAQITRDELTINGPSQAVANIINWWAEWRTESHEDEKYPTGFQRNKTTDAGETTADTEIETGEFTDCA